MSDAFSRLCREEPWRRPRFRAPKAQAPETSEVERRFNVLKARIVALRPFLPYPHYQTSTGLITISGYHRFQDAEHITMIPVERRGLPDNDVLYAPTIYQHTKTTDRSIYYQLDAHSKERVTGEDTCLHHSLYLTDPLLQRTFHT